jgi:hypothetical protein
MEKIRQEKILREKQAGRVIDFLDHMGAYEYVQNVLEGNGPKPSFEDFNNFLQRLNGIARGIPIKKRSLDGQNVQLSGFIENALIPRHDDKAELLKYAYGNIEKINKDEIKYLIPAVINAVHLFSDGNGRTSRIIYQLLERYASKADFERSLKLSLGQHGRYDSPDINPGLIGPDVEKIVLKKYGWEFPENKYPIGPGSLSVGKGISGPEISKLDKEYESYALAKRCLDISRDDPLYVLNAIRSVLGDERLKTFITDKYTLCKISPLKMVDQLTSDQWQQILDSYYQLKKEHVETIIDSFITPDNFSPYESERINLKDYFIQEIQGNYENNKAT